MRILKSHPLLKLVNSYVIDASQPSNLSYLWNFGSLLAVCLIIQIITGVTLAMHYNPSVSEAFNSVEHIMRDVNNGWLIRYLHSNTASAFFFIVYLHIGRGLYYGSYRTPRMLVWIIGTITFVLMIATAFLGYVLPYGQMSLWGATVITNLMSAIPWVGQDIVEFIWGGFSVNNATLNRFFSLHFLLPFVLAALALMHLIVLHDSAGSGNPLGISGNYDRLPFAPYFLFKDLITIFILIVILSIFVFFIPNALGDSENYVMANPMQTPPAIVPEWYLLPFYAILRSIPNKLIGVIAMFSAILILLAMPFTDLSRSRGIQFRPLSKIAFYVFLGNFLVLMTLGAKHVESPFIELGQVSTVIYFAHFLIIVPFISLFENSLIELNISKPRYISRSNNILVNNNKLSNRRLYSTYKSSKLRPVTFRQQLIISLKTGFIGLILISIIYFSLQFDGVIKILESPLPFIGSSLFTWALVLLYLDDFKLSSISFAKYIQIFSLIFIPLYAMYYIYTIPYLWDIILSIKDDKDINLHGHLTVGTEAGKAIGQGMSTIGSQIGLGATMVGVSTAVGKVITKSSMPPLQKAGIVIGGALIGGFGHSIISTINRNTVSLQSSSNFVNNNVNSSINKLVDDSSLSSLQVLLFDIYGINATCLSLMIILIIQIGFKFNIKDNIKFNLSNVLGVNLNNKIEYYINKIITLNKKMSSIYIWLIIMIIIVGLSLSIYASNELYTNIDSYINMHNSIGKK